MRASRPWITFDLATVLSLVLVLALSRMAYSHWIVVHQVNMADMDAAWRSVLDRTPHWRAYQNRLLGPAVLMVMGWVASTPLVLFVKGALVALNMALYLMVRQCTGSHLKSIFTVVLATMMWTVLTHYWSYPWDYIEAACLLALVHMAMRGWSLPGMLLLFGVALLNRESAVFIGFFLFAYGAALRWTGPAGPSQDMQAAARKWMAWGLGLMLLTLVWTEALRHALFDYSSLAGIRDDAQHLGFGNHRNHAANLEVVLNMWRAPQPVFFVIALLGMALLKTLVQAVRIRSAALLAMGVTLVAYLLSLAEFGLLSESRIYQPLVWCLPLLLAHAWVAEPQPAVSRG